MGKQVGAQLFVADQSCAGGALLCGIGFTMSLFISSLAFEHSGAQVVAGAADAGHARLGILSGSLVSGVLGYLVLRFSLARKG
ncbi:sodium/proton antiporter, NhaA family [Magnetococcus marinus MC-1]|uniref:Sodium/proton antiporter, NhaA family n=1 Tax=Magnetococcus marinus (strain ATCC BAA-1437 / JCM 17883 / MC-1) TaxID=156889 RepID=A0L5H4_MAGMM|nr:Na+/H+ antiporter NhaA [Magnetococcus marinus]ABK43217.1 sodium/proton antiporter, NhaA family [Magnetococcus marinus MC-1]